MESRGRALGMAGRAPGPRASDVLPKIRGLVRSLVIEVRNHRLPSVVLDRYRTYCLDPLGSCNCGMDISCGKNIITFDKESHARRIAIMLKVLLIVQQLLQEDKHGSKRDIYYMHPSVFMDQSVVDQAINDICVLLQCSRHNLNVVPVGKGFLRYLVEKLYLPVYCLVDCDPFGLDILMIYRFGSTEMAYDAKFLCVAEVRWLGVFPSDHEKYHLPDRCLLPLTPEEKKKAEAMLSRCYLRRKAPEWRMELETMLQKGVKFEIEALSVTSFSFLSEEYIPSRIESGVI